MAEHKKLVVVLGATGSQGGPTVRYILKHSSHLYRVRALTRDVTKPAAKSLAILGAEVVAVDFDDEASVVAALEGANSIFVITNFWDKADYDLEVTQGKLINKVASQVQTLEDYVFSSLPDGRKLLGGKYQNILPYNAKAAIREDLLANYPELYAKTTELWIAYYYQNWVKYQAVFGPIKQSNGTYVLSMPFPPSTIVPSSSSDDVGVLVDTVIRSDGKYRRQTIVLSGYTYTQDYMLDVFAKVNGVNAVFEHVSFEDHYKRLSAIPMPPHLAQAVTELSDALKEEYEALNEAWLLQGKDIIPKEYKLETWEDYVKREDWSPIL